MTGRLRGSRRFWDFPEVEFIQRYTRVTQDRRGLAVEDKANGEYIFLDEKDCSVRLVKPRQCKEFPNLWNFPGFQEVCKAIPREVSEAEHGELLGKK